MVTPKPAYLDTTSTPSTKILRFWGWFVFQSLKCKVFPDIFLNLFRCFENGFTDQESITLHWSLSFCF